MNEIRFDPKQTYALVVGIDTDGLNGPAQDAFNFFKYLINEVQVPATHVSLLLSPLEENQTLLSKYAPEPEKATQQKVAEAINELRKQSGELLILYWAGHGIANLEGKRQLFYADARDHDRRNLYLNSLLRSLRTSAFGGIRRNVIFVDTCAIYEEDWDRSEFSTPNQEFPDGAALDTYQFVIYAARLGQAARNSGRWSLLGRLLPKLRAAEHQWLTELKRIAESLIKEFENEDSWHRPVYYCKDWNGNEQEGPSRKRKDQCLITLELARKLVKSLASLEIAPERLWLIYSVCAPDSVLYDLSSVAAKASGRDLMRSLVFKLRGAPKTKKGFHPLLRLAIHLERETGAHIPLIEWIDEAAGVLGISHELLEQQRYEVITQAEPWSEVQSVLLVIVAPARATTIEPSPAPDDLEVRAGLLREPYTATNWQDLRLTWLNPASSRFKLAELESKIHDWVAECPGELRVEVFLPEHLLSLDVDQWRPPSRVRQPTLGAAHLVVVRSWDRAYNTKNPEYRSTLDRWRRNWEFLDKCQRQNRDLPIYICRPGDLSSRGKTFHEKVLEGYVCAVIDRRPRATEPPLEAHVWLSGIPIAVWRRSQMNDDREDKQWQDWLSSLEKLRGIREWARNVQATRHDSEMFFGTEITFLYDTPCKLPMNVPESSRLRQPTRFDEENQL